MHRAGLSPVPLSGLHEAIQRTEQWPSEPDAISERRDQVVVLWRLRYKLSLRDLAEMFLIRGFVFTYEAVRDWEAKLTPALVEQLRRSRKGKVGRSWYTDESVPQQAA